MRLPRVVKGAGLCLGVLALLGPAPVAQASDSAGARRAAADKAAAACSADEHGAAAGARTAHGRGRGARDHEELAPEVLARVNKQIADVQAQLHAATSGLLTSGSSRASSGRTVAGSSARLASPLYVNVYVHNIYGKHAGERDIAPATVHAALTRMNTDFATGERTGAARSRYRFRLMSNAIVNNDAWFHAEADGATDRYWRRRTHRGTKRDLNIYVRDLPGGLLGFATFPWNVSAAPGLDGVSVHGESLPGRRLTNYNQGDTLTHETGHWLGLLHTFQGGCSSTNDGVADTAPQAQLNGCPAPSKTCGLGLFGGYSNPENFMQYTYDSCMVSFTTGQVSRMDAAWTRWRL